MKRNKKFPSYTRNIKLLFAVFVFLLVSFPLKAKERQVISFDKDWRFLKVETRGAAMERRLLFRRHYKTSLALQK